MSIFKQQQQERGTATSSDPIIPILKGADNFLEWNSNLRDHADVHNGTVGQNLFNPEDITLEHAHPGKAPSELDERVNPLNGKIVPGQLKYPRKHSPTTEQTTTPTSKNTKECSSPFAPMTTPS